MNREKFEQIIPELTAKYLVFDTYYVDERFIRIITTPKEILNYIQVHTLFFRKKRDKAKTRKDRKE